MEEPIPEQLCRFVASEWPAAESVREATQQWMDAKLAWVAEHPGTLLGDSIDVMQETLRVRRRLQQHPPTY